jgi:hypothetical protein
MINCGSEQVVRVSKRRSDTLFSHLARLRSHVRRAEKLTCSGIRDLEYCETYASIPRKDSGNEDCRYVIHTSRQ